MAVYGYVRVSTKNQNPERQIVSILKLYPNAKIYQEKKSGRKMDNREEFQKLIKIAKSGDVIVFDSASRMSRNADEGCEQYQKWYEAGINLVFANEPQINTEVYKKELERQIGTVSTGNKDMDKCINTMIQALNEYTISLAKQQFRIVFEQAQKESDDNSKRTKGGMAVALEAKKEMDPNAHYGHSKGTQLTVKKKAPAMAEIKRLSRDFEGSNKDSEVMKITHLSRNTYYKYKKELEAQLKG